MSWKMIGKPVTTKVNHALAARFAEMEAAPGDRLTKEWRVKSMATAITSGAFRTCEWASARCAETGKTYRVNGKHTSTAMNAMNGELPKDIHVIVENYECDTLEDVAKLYATFDTRKSTRSVPDINRSFAASIGDLEGVAPRIVGLAVTGMSLVTWGAHYTAVDAEVRASLLHQHPDFVLWLNNIVKNPMKNKHITRGSIVAAMFTTWLKSRKDATAFWGLVRDGSGEKHTNADRVLHKYLLTNSVTSTQDRRGLLARCITGWNAWRSGSTTDLKYYPAAKLPVAK